MGRIGRKKKFFEAMTWRECDVESCANWLGCPCPAFALGVLSSIFFEFNCHCGFVFVGIRSASSRKITFSPAPPPRLGCNFTADFPVCVGVHGLLLLFSCLFFMMFQLIHHTPCALEWNSTHMNPWRLKKSSQGIFRLFVCLTCTFNQPGPPSPTRLNVPAV